jgi:hypothetical protein
MSKRLQVLLDERELRDIQLAARVDSNVPMDLVGAPHPHKADGRRLLEACITAGQHVEDPRFDTGFDGYPGVERIKP